MVRISGTPLFGRGKIEITGTPVGSSMRALLAAIVGACVMLAASLVGADGLTRVPNAGWLADAVRVSHVMANRFHRGVAIPGVRSLVATRDGGAWAMSAQRLLRISHAGVVSADIDLTGAGYGEGVILALDPYDESAWIVSDARLLLHFAGNGSLVYGTTLPAVADALAVGLDQTPWLLVNGELSNLLDGRWERVASFQTPVPVQAPVPGQMPVPVQTPVPIQTPGPVKGSVAFVTTRLVVDSLRDRIWLADSHALWRVQLHRGLRRSDGEAILDAPRAIALNPRSGDLWTVVEQRLIALDSDGIARVERRLPMLADEGPVALHHEAESDTVLVHASGTLARVSRDGQVLDALMIPSETLVNAPPSLRVDPSLALLRPPAGGATYDPSAEFVLRRGALCNGNPCDVPAEYFDDLSIVAEVDGVLANDAVLDAGSDTAVVTPRRPMRPGLNRLIARANDRFGHAAELTAAITVLEREPDADSELSREDAAGGSSSDAAARELPSERPRARKGAGNGTPKAPNKVPSVSLASPVSGTTFSSGTSITLKATATDADGTIAKVEFYRGGSTLIGTATAAPYQAVWQNAAAGNYSITAKAYDNRNGTATSAPVTIAVTNNQLPTAVLTSPAQGAFYAAGTPIQLFAMTGDPDGIVVRVEFFDGSSPIGVVNGAPFTTSWTNASPGAHSIVARAIDDKGGTGDSQGIDIVVGEPPIVVVKSPVACSTVDAPVDVVLAADAISATGVIVRVEFFDGATLVGTSHSAPWYVTLSGAASGAHSITAQAIDDHGFATTSRPAVVTVRSSNQPPSVTLTSPSEGATFALGSVMNLAASASDSDGTIAAVEYRLGGSGGPLLGRATAAPYSVSWASAAAGSHTVVAVAVDDRGATTTSAPVHITVVANAPPFVTLTAPAAGASYVAPATIVLGASASDANGSITKVEFYAGTTLVGSSTAAPFTTNWNGVAAGTYSLTARATDNLGAVTTSAAVAVSVGSNAPPAVMLTSPAAGTQYFAPATIALSATASDSDGTIVSVDFRANGVLVGTSTTAPFGIVWDGVGGGVHSITATAVDNGGGATTTSAVSITVSGAPTLNIAADLEGATIDDDNVLVRGFVSAPANSALTVNGVVTHIDDYGRFQANNVPLSPGANTVTAVVTTQDGQSTSHSVTVGSTGPGPFKVLASPTEGLNSLAVTFTVENVADLAFKQINFDLDGDGLPNVIATSGQFVDGTLTVTATYPVGTWIAVIKVYDDDDRVLYTTSKSIVVLMPGALQVKLRGVYDGTLARLKTGNITGALTAFTGSAYARYEAIFTQLQSTLASVVDQLGEVEEVNFDMDLAEFSVVRNTPEGLRLFLLYLIRAEDGIWRFDGM